MFSIFFGDLYFYFKQNDTFQLLFNTRQLTQLNNLFTHDDL